jgi:hypothetical protein
MKIFRVAFGIGALLAVSSPGSAQSVLLTPEQRADGEVQVAQAGKLLADSVRDTDAVKFRNVFLQKTVGTDGKEHVSLCGEVNAKNGYGGMSGFHKFMLVADQVYVGGPGQIINADEICGNGRAKIDTRDYSPEIRKAFDANAGQ